MKSLEVTCICARNNSDIRSLCKLVDLFPNLIALDLSLIDMSQQLEESGHNMESFVARWPKLKELHFVYGNEFSDDDLLSIILTMCDLEDIILPWKTLTRKCKQPQRIIAEIVQCLPKLKSFLNPPPNLNVCEIPSLMYKSHSSGLNKIMVKRQGGHQQNPHSTEKPSAKKRKINPKWDTICGNITFFPEALGFRYFYSESYYRN